MDRSLAALLELEWLPVVRIAANYCALETLNGSRPGGVDEVALYVRCEFDRVLMTPKVFRKVALVRS